MKNFFCAMVLCCIVSCNMTTNVRPNILVLLADDMGYGDLGCYGGEAKTPNLDELASNGIKFTNCYSGAPNCSPSRVSLLTGKIPLRVGMYSYRQSRHVMHLRDNEVILPELLKSGGYQTAHFGKWHLGCLPQDTSLNHPQPDQQSFDYSFGTESNTFPSHLNPTNFIRNGKKLGELKGYSCQLLANEIENWFENTFNDQQPFFMYVPFNEPHAKVASPPGMVAHYPDYDKFTAKYFANIENMDNAVGRILAKLKSEGLYENTMVFFSSDNGSYRLGSNKPLRGLKGEVYDGGIKVPGIITFPNQFSGKREIDQPIWFQDLLPTVCNLAQVEIPQGLTNDGLDLVPLLKNRNYKKREQAMLWVFYRSSPEIAMRSGDYMLVARTNDTIARTHYLSDIDIPFIKNLEPDFFELYNIEKDVGQQHDLAGREPEKLKKLKVEFQALFDEVIKEGPVWEGLPVFDPLKATQHKPTQYLKNQKMFLK